MKESIQIISNNIKNFTCDLAINERGLIIEFSILLFFVLVFVIIENRYNNKIKNILFIEDNAKFERRKLITYIEQIICFYIIEIMIICITLYLAVIGFRIILNYI